MYILMQIIKINKLSHFSAETGKDRFMNENVQKCHSQKMVHLSLFGVSDRIQEQFAQNCNYDGQS